MNHSSTKSLVEFLHAYLNFINRFPEKIQVTDHKEGVSFISECLHNHLANRDILTQCSIIFWMLFKLSPVAQSQDAFKVLQASLSLQEGEDLYCLLDKDFKVDSISNKPLKKGILSMARVRGFVLTIDKDIDTNI